MLLVPNEVTASTNFARESHLPTNMRCLLHNIRDNCSRFSRFRTHAAAVIFGVFIYDAVNAQFVRLLEIEQIIRIAYTFMHTIFRRQNLSVAHAHGFNYVFVLL